jgi:hypothetical protein
MSKTCAFAVTFAIVLLSCEASLDVEDDWLEKPDTFTNNMIDANDVKYEIVPPEEFADQQSSKGVHVFLITTHVFPDSATYTTVTTKVGGFPNIGAAAKAAYEKITNSVAAKVVAHKAKSVAKYASTQLVRFHGMIKEHPYVWCAFKVAVGVGLTSITVVTAIFAPQVILAAFIVKAAFAVMDSAVELKNLKDAQDDLPAELGPDARAACMYIPKAKAILVVANAVASVFLPLPIEIPIGAGASVSAAAGAAGGAVVKTAEEEAIASVDWKTLFDEAKQAGSKGPAEKALVDIAKGSVTGAIGQATDDKVNKALDNIKNAKGKLAKLSCSRLAQKQADTNHLGSVQGHLLPVPVNVDPHAKVEHRL